MTPIEQKIEADFEEYFKAFLQEKDGKIVIGSPGTRTYELDKKYLSQFCREISLPLHQEIEKLKMELALAGPTYSTRELEAQVKELKEALDWVTGEFLEYTHVYPEDKQRARELREKFKLDEVKDGN